MTRVLAGVHPPPGCTEKFCQSGMASLGDIPKRTE